MIRGKSLSTLNQLAKKHSHAHIGLHFNLVEGRSIHKRSLIPSLVRKGGHFYPFWVFVILLFSSYIKRHHIERELSEQYNFLVKQGLRIDTIDSHQHIHALSPVSEIVTEFARKHSIQVIRSYKNIAAFTWSAKIKLFTLKISAIISYYLAYKQLGLPESWRIPSSYRISFLNWEGETPDLSKSILIIF